MSNDSADFGFPPGAPRSDLASPDNAAAVARHRQGAASAGGLGTRRAFAALLMVTGVAWNAGLQAQPFHPVLTGVAALAVHVLPLAVLMLLVVPVLRSGSVRGRLGRGVSIAAVVALVFGVLSILFSVTVPHAAMGIHDVNDLLPFAFLDVGALLWLVPLRREAGRTGG